MYTGLEINDPCFEGDLLKNKMYTGLKEINYPCFDCDLLKNKMYTGFKEINYPFSDTVICYRIKHTLA